MAYLDYIPKRDAEFVTWSTAFSTKINAAPTDFGLTLLQAADYQTLAQAFADAYALAADSATNSGANVAAKDNARTALEESTRELVNIIQADPAVTNDQREFLNIPVRDTDPTPVPQPTTSPIVTIDNTFQRLVSLRLADTTTPTSRAKPDGVDGATIMFCVGDVASANETDWNYLVQTSRTIFDVEIPDFTPADSRIWIKAFWYNTKGQTGPPSAAQTTTIGGDLAQAA